jgi:2'-5' RNA ligase superfamily
MQTADLVRVDFALIPDDALFGTVITASQAITRRFCYNANVIDATTFPPHLSLLICTIPGTTLAAVTAELEALAAAGLPDIAAITVAASTGGYVMLTIDRTPGLMALHEAILGVAARARGGLDGDPFGSPYIRDSFTPHISLAKIDTGDQADAAAIGLRTLRAPRVAHSRALDLCSIGERSDRWDILTTCPAASNRR